MNAVLLVGHGSRNNAANEQFNLFAKKVKNKCNSSIFRYCFLELAVPSIQDEINKCVKDGAKRIFVYPLLLLAANHVKCDLPAELALAKKNYPNLSFHLFDPLGIQEVLISILEARLKERGFTQQATTQIVFVGRGSRDNEAISDFEKIRVRLQDRVGESYVTSCFLVGGHRSFQTALEDAISSSAKSIYVLPYLLFQGLLFHRVEKEVRLVADHRLHVCQPLGVDDLLVDLVVEKINIH